MLTNARPPISIRFSISWCEQEVVLEFQRGLGVVFQRLKVDDEIVLDSENGIGLQPWIIVGVDLVHHLLVSVRRNHHVDVRRSPWMTVQQLQKLPRRPIPRQRIRRRLQAVVVIVALRIRLELSAQVVGALVVGVLEVVLSIRRRLPDVDRGIDNGLLGIEVDDFAVHERDLAVVLVLHDLVAQLAPGGVGGPEWAEDGAGGGNFAGFRDVFVGDFVDETGGC